MGFLSDRARGHSEGLMVRRRIALGVAALWVGLLVWGGSQESWALQRHTLVPEEGTGAQSGHSGVPPTVQSSVASGHGEQPAVHPVVSVQAVPQAAQGRPAAPSGGSGHATTPPQLPQSQGHEVPGATPDLHKQASGAQGDAAHEPAPGHGAEAGAHGPALPQLSPIAGVTFVETMINLMEHELNGRFWGWRPNDLLVGRFTDNINYYQLGVLEAMRFTTLRLKDSLTRMGDADTYDPDLEQALNLFMNRATLFWFPSAESSYQEAVDHLRNFLRKLESGQRNFYYRKDNLQMLLSVYKDLLGNVNKTLIVSPVSWFKVDDYFYYAKGVAHVYYEILRVVRVGFQNQLSSTLYALDIMDEIIHELHRVEVMDPWIILDSDLDGLMANHRANMNAPLSEAAHLLGVLSQL